MQQVIVSYPHSGGKIEVKRKLMACEADLREYFGVFPDYKTKANEEMFKREIRESGVLIINSAGGWCVETKDIKIVQYL